MSSVVRRVWTSPDGPARAARRALLPLELIYGAAVATRCSLYNSGLLPARPLALPSVSVGNLTVGGTGKTPVSAWLVAELAARGARPAVVLRDYGGDEALVHAALNPTAVVVTGPDRVEAVRRAQTLGADVAVLDDAFQHRRARRDVDIVLLSADAWTPSRRLLPAGPWREPLSAVRRASLVIVTRKAAPLDVAEAVLSAAAAGAPRVPRAVIRLAPTALVDAHGGDARALSSIVGEEVVAVAGIADPEAFVRQLREVGARVRLHAYADHYAFRSDDAVRLANAAERPGFVVCTLKDAVKLAPVWPRSGPALWYLSQQVILERGRPEVERVIGDLLGARARYSRTAG